MSKATELAELVVSKLNRDDGKIYEIAQDILKTDIALQFEEGDVIETREDGSVGIVLGQETRRDSDQWVSIKFGNSHSALPAAAIRHHYDAQRVKDMRAIRQAAKDIVPNVAWMVNYASSTLKRSGVEFPYTSQAILENLIRELQERV